MKYLLYLAAIAAILYGLHRLFLWMEQKGWIYYMRKRASPDTAGTAALNLQQIVDPGARHMLEVRRKRKSEHHSEEDKTP